MYGAHSVLEHMFNFSFTLLAIIVLPSRVDTPSSEIDSQLLAQEKYSKQVSFIFYCIPVSNTDLYKLYINFRSSTKPSTLTLFFINNHHIHLKKTATV
jgi:hypothetical protein